MLKYIRFNKFFNRNNNENELCDLTDNTIIICENYYIKNRIYHQIYNTINCLHGCNIINDYYCEYNEMCNVYMNYKPTAILNIYNQINLQKIIISVEVPFILQAKDIKDIWIATIDNNYRISVIPMTLYKKSDEIWNSGIWETYKYILSGRYGDVGNYEKMENKI